jgi:uncharacterized membrane protein (UPF0127 family)
MKTHHKLAILATFVIVILIAIFVIPNFDTVGNHWRGYEEIPYEIEGETYKLLVADTEKKRKVGLMNIDKNDLNGFDGMLFKFEDTEIQTFWNRNTHVDLTVYWIVNGEVIGRSQLPAIDTAGEKTVSSPKPVDTVIEIVQ